MSEIPLYSGATLLRIVSLKRRIKGLHKICIDGTKEKKKEVTAANETHALRRKAPKGSSCRV